MARLNHQGKVYQWRRRNNPVIVLCHPVYKVRDGDQWVIMNGNLVNIHAVVNDSNGKITSVVFILDDKLVARVNPCRD